MDNSVVINQVLILFLIIAIGFIARKKDIITATGGADLTRLLLYVTSPLTIFTSSFNWNTPGRCCWAPVKFLPLP